MKASVRPRVNAINAGINAVKLANVLIMNARGFGHSREKRTNRFHRGKLRNSRISNSIGIIQK